MKMTFFKTVLFAAVISGLGTAAQAADVQGGQQAAELDV